MVRYQEEQLERMKGTITFDITTTTYLLRLSYSYSLVSGQVPGGAFGEDEKRHHKTTTTSLLGLSYYYSLVRYREEELERLMRDQRTTTTYLVGLSYYYSMVRYQEWELQRMKGDLKGTVS
jgi:hypothetical protein